MNDVRDTSHRLLFMYVGMIMHHGISFESAIDTMHEKILNADYENDTRDTENKSTAALVYIEEVLFG